MMTTQKTNLTQLFNPRDYCQLILEFDPDSSGQSYGVMTYGDWSDIKNRLQEAIEHPGLFNFATNREAQVRQFSAALETHFRTQHERPFDARGPFLSWLAGYHPELLEDAIRLDTPQKCAGYRKADGNFELDAAELTQSYELGQRAVEVAAKNVGYWQRKIGYANKVGSSAVWYRDQEAIQKQQLETAQREFVPISALWTAYQTYQNALQPTASRSTMPTHCRPSPRSLNGGR